MVRPEERKHPRYRILYGTFVALLLACAGLCLPAPAGAQAPAACPEPADSDFRLVPVATGKELLQMELDREGRLFFISKDGEVRLFHPVTRENKLLATLPVNDTGYMGLLSLALDPGFPARPWIYLLHNPSDGRLYPDFRLSRFTFDGQKLDLASEKRILEIPNKDNHQPPAGTHTGGKLAFGPDSLLHITSGDNSKYGDFSPIDDRTPEGTALFTSGNTNHLGGKILRIRVKDDGTYAIPAGNLFAPGTAGTRAEIYAMGLRNPYSIHVDPKRGWLLVGEVGSDGPAAFSPRGPGGGDEYNVIRKPGNFGWPMFTGPNLPYSRFDFATGTVGAPFDPARPVNESRWNTGLKDLPPAQPSVFDILKYNPDTLAVRMGFKDRTMVSLAGPLVRYRLGLSPAALPPQFHGRWIIGNYAMNRIGLLTLDSSGTKVLAGRPLFANQTFRSLMDFRLGPDGVLHFLETTGRIARLEYMGTVPTPAQCGLRTGCTRPGFLQFDPRAEVDDGSCRTPVAMRPAGARGLAQEVAFTASDIILSGPGPYRIRFAGPDGRIAAASEVLPPGRHRLAGRMPRGVWTVIVSRGSAWTGKRMVLW